MLRALRLRLFFLSEAVALAWQALWSHRLRTALSMLGVVIGIFCISGVFALVESMQVAITERLDKLGNTVVYIHKWPWKDNSDDWFEYIKRPQVTYGDFEGIRPGLRYANAAAFEAKRNGRNVKFGTAPVEGVTVVGHTADYLAINGLDIQKGRAYTLRELEAGRNVCLVGATLARLLGGGREVVGQEVQVEGRRLRVIGVLAPWGDNPFGNSLDDQLLMPYATFQRLFRVERRSVNKVIMVRASDYTLVPAMEANLRGLMRQSRGLKPTKKDDFSINKQEAVLKEFGQVFYYLDLGGFIIGAFSLLVGGFGIANILYVSVKERTVQIGTQKALGATQGFILSQFLIEALLLCGLGGLIGLGILFGLVPIVNPLVADFGFKLIVSPRVAGIGLGIATALGLLAGLLPSFQAARLNPVVAMRSTA